MNLNKVFIFVTLATLLLLHGQTEAGTLRNIGKKLEKFGKKVVEASKKVGEVSERVLPLLGAIGALGR
ncbi:hypothetical protein ZHAS_00007083 [Anopheles sinensis]|uniref:Cecropin n=1 Tax=Anopheles sinensis TaxID=74873 RepID=A0A084VNU2_ANOSI|nr:hypothetical protein ZHAS_00007083 [Anopheles sinensis]